MPVQILHTELQHSRQLQDAQKFLQPNVYFPLQVLMCVFNRLMHLNTDSLASATVQCKNTGTTGNPTFIPLVPTAFSADRTVAAFVHFLKIANCRRALAAFVPTPLHLMTSPHFTPSLISQSRVSFLEK